MCSKKISKNLKKKRRAICCYTGKPVSPQNVLDKNCAISYLRSQGYEIIDCNLRRVFFVEEKNVTD